MRKKILLAVLLLSLILLPMGVSGQTIGYAQTTSGILGAKYLIVSVNAIGVAVQNEYGHSAGVILLNDGAEVARKQCDAGTCPYGCGNDKRLAYARSGFPAWSFAGTFDQYSLKFDPPVMADTIQIFTQCSIGGAISTIGYKYYIDSTPPAVAVTGAPASWQNADATAGVSCIDGGTPISGCSAPSYRLLVYSSNPGSCPADYNAYTLLPSQTISSHSWVCAAAKDNMGNTGFSAPAEFRVDEILPMGTITINNGALYTTSSSVTLSLTYSDTGDSGIQGCRYSNDGVSYSAWEACNPTKAWTLTPGLGQRIAYYQIRDNAGNIYGTKASIFVISSADACNYASNGFYCCARNGACQGSEVDVFHMSDRGNSHAEIFSQSNYPYRMCCGGVPGLGRDCSGTVPYDTPLKLSSQTNAHVEKKTLSNYPFPACLSIAAGFATCDYTNAADCSAVGAGYACVATISSDTNAHVSDCDGIGDFATKVCCRFGPPPCQLQTARISLNDANSNGVADIGETVSMSATTTGYCTPADFFQIDALGGCSLQYSVPPGDLSGIFQNNPTIAGDTVSGTVTGTWTIASIPNACSGKTVTASTAGLYDGGPPGTGTGLTTISGPPVTGSFKFKDVIAPTSVITAPAAGSWQAADFLVSISDSDEPGGSGLFRCEYKVDSNGVQTRGWTARTCSSPVTITVGSAGDCRNQGPNTCNVSVRAIDNAGNMGSDFRRFGIDWTVPTFTVSVSHSPSNPTDMDPVTFTASASDAVSGLSQITIYVDGVPIGSCATSPCAITPGTYPTGTHRYNATARDAAGNIARDPSPSGDKQFTVTGCSLTSARIIPNCAGGSSPNCEIGERISMSATTTGNCAAARFFQIDASGGCTLRFSGGDLSGISNSSSLIISGGYVNGTWTIASIPAACSAKTVTASTAYLYNAGPPPTGLMTSIASPSVTGSFTFKDVLPPTTALNSFMPDPTNDNTPTYTGTATDSSSNIAVVQYRINGGAWQNAQATDGSFNSPNEAFTFTPSALADGTHLFEARAQDSSGNWEIAPYASDNLMIDTTPPTAAVNPLPAWTNQNSIPVSWSGSDGSGSGISNYNVQYRSTWANGTAISGLVDWLSTGSTSGTFSPARNNYTYYFRVRATDNAGNTGAYSAERSTSIDNEIPAISYTIDDSTPSSIRIISSAQDNISGISSHTISCIGTNPSTSNFSLCSAAAPFGGVSTCQTDAIPYTQDSEINCDITAQDRAGNAYTTNIFWSFSADHPLAEFVEHSVFISLGETGHAKIHARNLNPSSNMVNITFLGSYPAGLARFLPSSNIIWISPDRRNITVLLSPYEQKTIYAEMISTDPDVYTLNLSAGSQNLALTDSDSMEVTIGYHASFPGIELWSIAILLSVSCLAYFIYLRGRNKI